MKNFIISALIDLVLIIVFYELFKLILKGPTRHKLYEKFLSSFAKFIIYIFLITVIITGLSALILYRSRYISYLNIIASALVSVFVGFIMSIVPVKGAGDDKK